MTESSGVTPLLVDYKRVNWNSINVSYTKQLDKGGIFFADDFIQMMMDLKVKPLHGRLLEWCSGAGYIGFALMACGFCDSVALTDNDADAIAAARHTAEVNGLGSKAAIYCGDGITTLPDEATFDLIVGNPPNFPNRVQTDELCKEDPKAQPSAYVDPDWRLHNAFYSGIRKHLTPNGRIILLESTNASHLETFRPMIEAHGLVINGWQWSKKRGTDMWYLFVSRDDATTPFPVDTPPD